WPVTRRPCASRSRLSSFNRASSPAQTSTPGVWDGFMVAPGPQNGGHHTPQPAPVARQRGRTEDGRRRTEARRHSAPRSCLRLVSCSSVLRPPPSFLLLPLLTRQGFRSCPGPPGSYHVESAVMARTPGRCTEAAIHVKDVEPRPAYSLSCRALPPRRAVAPG